MHFIRRLPDLTAEEITRMEALNPKTPEQFREEKEIRRFISGEDVPSEAAPAAPSRPHH